MSVIPSQEVQWQARQETLNSWLYVRVLDSQWIHMSRLNVDWIKNHLPSIHKKDVSFLYLIGKHLRFQTTWLSLELRIWRISEKYVNKGTSLMSIYINMDFHKRYCSSHAIHNQLILENGWHLSPIHISTLATLIWLVFIYSCLSFRVSIQY